MIDELTRTATRAALANLADAQHKIADPDTPAPDHEAALRDLPKLLRAAREALELHADPDPPEPEAVDLLTDPATVAAALLQEDPAQWLTDKALQADALTAGPEALRRVLRLGHRDEAAPPDLVAAADRELRRRERAARRAERLAMLAADAATATGDAADVRRRLTAARTALQEVHTMRPVVSAAQHAEPRTDWTGEPPDREWLLPGWLAVGRVHLLTGAGGRGKSRLALQLAAALAADGAEWPLPWMTADERPTRSGAVDHPLTLPPTDRGGAPVVVASWEDEADEVHRRLIDQPVPVSALADRLHYVDAAEWGPLWAPVGTAHVQTVAELTAAGRRLRRLCERVGARLLVVDPLAAAYGSDENVRGMVRQYMASWDAWGRAQRCAILMIAHPPKATAGASDDWWSGSTDWPAAARSAWALRHAKATDAAQKKATQPERTWLECMKASYGKAPDPVHLTADGVTWRATWEPQAEAPAGNVNDTGKVDPTERAALDAL